jgi:hypothetical protein
MQASQSLADGLEKFLPAERLLEHTAVTWPIERRAMQQVGATGDQDHWQAGPPGLNRSGEFKTVDDGHADVRDQALNLVNPATLQQRRCRRKQARVIARGFQQNSERFENPQIIVGHRDDGAATVVRRGHARILSDGRAAFCNRKM